MHGVRGRCRTHRKILPDGFSVVHICPACLKYRLPGLQEEEAQMHKNSRLSSFGFTALFVMGLSMLAFPVSGQEIRKRISSPQPIYPELARRINLSGVVKIELIVGPDGEIKESKVLGGHPLLADAALTTLRNWKYERSKTETKLEVEFKFHM